jgi:imidazolonepropionase-like amidohydrolase
MLTKKRQLLLLVFALASASLALTPWLNAQQQPVAFVDVTVVPMDKEQLLLHQTVLVAGGRIAQVGPSASTKPPRGALSIDGKGKFLMPGLADMHVHFIRPATSIDSQPSASSKPSVPTVIAASASADHEQENQAFGLLFVASGVTTVRNMWGDPGINAFAREVDSGRVLGPHIYATGPVTDGNPPVFVGGRAVETKSEAEAAVKQDKEAGYIALKVLNRLSLDAYNWLVSSAKAQGLPVVGHVPYAVGLRRVIEARQYSIEHLEGFWESLQPDESIATASWRTLVEKADFSKLPPLVEAIQSGGVWNCPTLVLNQVLTDDAEWQRRIALVPPDIPGRYRKMYPQWNPDAALTLKAYQQSIFMMRVLHESGAHLLLGTDSFKPTVIPGFSLHQELQSFAEAGLTPYEAIRAGTVDAAIFLHQENEFGTVATGRRADLLLLEANPLQDVKNVSKRAGVMVNGHWLTEAELQHRLVDLRNSYQH